MAGLDQFYSDLTTTDTKKKITIGHNIINYLEDDNNSIECDDIGGFIDGLVPWMQSSNFKVKQVLEVQFLESHNHQQAKPSSVLFPGIKL